MSSCFYTIVDNIREKIAGYLDSNMVQNGLNFLELDKEHKALYVSATDSYSSSLIRKGVSSSKSCLFSNIPYSRYTWIIGDNLERVFEALGLPTTQAAAYRLSNNLNRKGVTGALTSEQLESLRNLDVVKAHYDKVLKWCNDAREVIEIVRANLVLLDSVTEEEKEFARSLNFDWYYSYSDDREVYRRGEEQRKEVAKHVNEVLATKPYLSKVVDEVARAHNFNRSFFTDPR